jgi:hypothetical protein
VQSREGQKVKDAESRKPAHQTATGLMLRGCVVMLVVVLLADPSGAMLHLKMTFFALVMLLWTYRQFRVSGLMDRERDRNLDLSVWTTTLAVAVVIPFIWTMIGMFASNVHSGDEPLGLLKSFLFFSIVPVLMSEGIDLMPIIGRASLLVAAITFLLVAISLVSRELLTGVMLFIMDQKNGIITPERNVLGLGEFYYATCPVMIFPFTWYCSRMMERRPGRLGAGILCAVFGAALVLSGARADILAVLGILLFFTLRKIRQRVGWAAALIVGVLTLTVATATVVPKFVDPKQGSNAIKLGHIHSYEEEFSRKPDVLIWGEGANSAFYSEGFQEWTTVTEVTWLELVRIFGLPMVLLFGAGLLWIAWRLFSRGAVAIGLAFVAYLGIAGSNPLILNSLGFLVVAAAYVHALQCAEDRQPWSASGVWGKPLSSEAST